MLDISVDYNMDLLPPSAKTLIMCVTHCGALWEQHVTLNWTPPWMEPHVVIISGALAVIASQSDSTQLLWMEPGDPGVRGHPVQEAAELVYRVQSGTAVIHRQDMEESTV